MNTLRTKIVFETNFPNFHEFFSNLQIHIPRKNSNGSTLVHAKLCAHKAATVGAKLHRLTYNFLIDIFSLHILPSVNSIEYQTRRCSKIWVWLL